MGITNSNKTISVDRIECDGTLRVTLALTAAPDIVTNPTDIALVLDRSGSMTGTPLTNMKAGARHVHRYHRRGDPAARPTVRSVPAAISESSAFRALRRPIRS